MRMTQIKIVFSTIAIVLMIISCANVSDSGTEVVDIIDNSDLPEWLIPKGQVINAAQLDGIPSVDTPKFETVEQAADYLTDQDLVIILKFHNELRAYPHAILDWHEMINDSYSQSMVTVSYCPLTGSGIAFEGRVNDSGVLKMSQFGVSGLLYNSNLIYYDRLTQSYWSQMRNIAVSGQVRGVRPEIIQSVETTFHTLKQYYPNAKILSRETGIYSAGQYRISPYNLYKNEEVIHYPLDLDDLRLKRKERVLAFHQFETKRIYRFENFSDSISIINDEIDGIPIAIIGSKKLDFMVGFERGTQSGNLLQLLPIQNEFPLVAKDQFGNKYDLFGKVTIKTFGVDLISLKGVIAYWFSWASMFHEMEIYGEL